MSVHPLHFRALAFPLDVVVHVVVRRDGTIRFLTREYDAGLVRAVVDAALEEPAP